MRTLAHPTFSSRRHQQGVGLIEVLIAVLVVSIGFLGVAALQVYSLSTNNSAMARSMATVASYSILDAMRADRDNALSSALPYNTTVTANQCKGIGTGATLAENQIILWCHQLAHNLGAASTTTGTVNCTTEGDCTVTISYVDHETGDVAKDSSNQPKAQTLITKVAI